MPIYEFYCATCHTIFNFLSKRVNTTSTPPCPRCAQALSRQVSAFAHLRGGPGADAGEGAADDGSPPLDESRMEQAMAGMGDEIERLGDESDPRQAADLMRRFAQASGMKFNATVEEALSRMAAGADPEAVEAEFGDALEAANPFAPDAEAGSKADQLKRLLRAAGPRRDPTLYDL